MVASVLIIVFASVLLIYWFRYTCILLLKDKPEESKAASVSAYKTALEADCTLDELHQALRRDFEVVTYIVEHASGIALTSLEHRLLLLDYRLMQWQYRLTKSLLPGRARRALSEMASVTDLLSSRLVNHSAAQSQAAS